MRRGERNIVRYLFCRFSSSLFRVLLRPSFDHLEADQSVHHTVQIVEKGQKVEAKLAPGLFLAVIQDVCIHHTHWIVHNLRAICGTVEKPPEVIEEQRDVKAQSHPLPRTHEHQAEQPVDGIFWNNQPSKEVADSLNVQYSFPRSGGVALIDGVFEVCAQLIKRNNLPDDEEDEGGAQHEC